MLVLLPILFENTETFNLKERLSIQPLRRHVAKASNPCGSQILM